MSQTSKHADCYTNVLLESHLKRKKQGHKEVHEQIVSVFDIEILKCTVYFCSGFLLNGCPMHMELQRHNAIFTLRLVSFSLYLVFDGQLILT